MEYSPTSRRSRKANPPKPVQEEEEIRDLSSSSDIYATMVLKDEYQNDDDSLPPLLKRLPKDFGGDPTLNFDDDQYDDGASVSGTMIVKTSKSSRGSRPPGQYWDRTQTRDFNDNAASYRSRFEGEAEEEEEGNFSTFVVKKGAEEDEEEEEEEMGSGTVVTRRKKSRGGGNGSAGGTMSRAVASMQAAGEIGGGFGRQRKGGSGGGGSIVEEGGSGDWLRGQGSGKMSTSSIPESVTKEDPATKYELLHELGKFFDCPISYLDLLSLLILLATLTQPFQLDLKNGAF